MRLSPKSDDGEMLHAADRAFARMNMKECRRWITLTGTEKPISTG